MGKEDRKVPEKLSSISPVAFDKLVNILQDISYGSIILTIHEGKVVQIEKNEKIRLR